MNTRLLSRCLLSVIFSLLSAYAIGQHQLVTTAYSAGAGSFKQAVLDANDGDSILFDPSLAGVSIELIQPVTIDKSLHIVGLNMTNPVTITGFSNLNQLIILSGPINRLDFKNLKVNGSLGSGSYTFAYASNIQVDSLIVDSVFATAMNNPIFSGGGSYTCITNSNFLFNGGSNGVILGINYSNVVHINNCRFEGNNCFNSQVDMIQFESIDTLNVSNCVFKDNYRIANNTFRDLISVKYVDACHFQNIQFLSNQAHFLLVGRWSNDIQMNHVTIDGANLGGGVAIATPSIGQLLVKNSLFKNLRFDAVMSNMNLTRIENSSIESCFNDSNSIINTFGNLELVNSTFKHNIGTPVENHTGTSTIDHCLFDSNTSNQGGALSLGTGGSLIIDSKFTNNYSTISGGAIYAKNSDSLILRRCLLSENTSGSSGGAIYSSASTSLITTTISNNHTLGTDGATVDLRLNDHTILNSTFCGNIGNGGAGVYSISQPIGTLFISGTAVADTLLSSQVLNEGQMATFTSGGYNAFPDSSDFYISLDQYNLNSSHFKLGSLSNGIHIPQIGSSLIDAGNPLDHSLAANGIVYVQREIGAAELKKINIDTSFACTPVSWQGNTYSNPIFLADTLFVPNTNVVDSIFGIALIPLEINIIHENGTLSSDTTLPSFSYQWVDCDSNSNIQGETLAAFTPNANGSYALIVQYGNCTDTSDCLLVQDVSINEYNRKAQSLIFPNPTRSELTIKINNPDITGCYLLNPIGQIVEDLNFKDSIKLNLNLPAGIYVIQWKSKSKQYLAEKLQIE